MYAGNLELNKREKDGYPIFKLKITSSKENGFYINKDVIDENGIIVEKNVDVRNLIRVLCNAAKEYYEKKKDNKIFKNHHIEIIDIEAEALKTRNSKEKFYKLQHSKKNSYSYNELSNDAKKVLMLINTNEKQTLIDSIQNNPDIVMTFV